MRNDVRRPKKIIQDEQVLLNEMMGEIRVVSKRAFDYLVRPIQNPRRDEHDRQRTHSSINKDETKRTRPK